MKWHVTITAAVVVAAAVCAHLIGREREERAADKAFQESVRKGETEYRAACGSCHAPYDARYHLFDDWRPIVDSTGCPAVHVELKAESKSSILDFLRARSAPTASEASTVREREKARAAGEQVSRGREIFVASCSKCHPNPYYPKTLTSHEWSGAIADIGGLHRSVQEPVWVADKESSDLLVYLGASAAGTPSDARAIRSLIENAAAVTVQPLEPEAARELPWLRDFEAGLARARESGKPLLVNFTDLSGG